MPLTLITAKKRVFKEMNGIRYEFRDERNVFQDLSRNNLDLTGSDAQKGITAFKVYNIS